MPKRKENTAASDSNKKGMHFKYEDSVKERVLELYKQGVKMTQIANEVCIDYKTVRRWVKDAALPEVSLQTKLASTGARINQPSLSNKGNLEQAGNLAPQDMEGWVAIGERYADGLEIQEWQAREITKAIALGIPERLAIGKGAVTPSEFDNWIKLSNRGIQPFKDWISFLTIAQVAAISDLVATVRDGHAHTWQGAAWLLARLRPEYFHKDVIRDQHNNALSEMDDEVIQRAAKEWLTGIDSESEHNKTHPTVINIDELNLD
jgi:transposase-like protein